MKQAVTVDDLKRLASEARESIWAQAEQYGREPKIYLHWTAGHYDQCSDHYHVNITGGGEVYLTNPLDAVVQGTWKRNSGSVSLTICGCWDATTNAGLGSEPPTEKQIEAMSQVIAAIAEGLWLTIDKNHVMTHGEAADNEDGIAPHEEYGPRSTCERWDLEYLGTEKSPAFNPWATDGTRGGDVLRGNANWYANEWRKSAVAEMSALGEAAPAPVPTPVRLGRAKYFSEEEMMCHGASQGHCDCGVDSAENVSSRLLELLDQLRENIGGPLEVSCMYRCPAHNDAIPGSAKNSQHVQGTAADIQTPNYDHCHTPEQLLWYCEQLPFDGLGLYDWGVHVDVRDGGIGSGVRW